MAGSLNKVMLIGNLGADPEIRSLQNGQKVANLRIATSESWKDKDSGERKERTEWHRIVIWTEGLVNVVEKYLKKGDKIYVEGQLQTRKWEKDGQDQYSTEIVLQGFGSSLTMLSTQGNGDGGGDRSSDNGRSSRPGATRNAPAFERGGMDDDIPF
jgi:single-strand DNA-binding protein